MFILCPQCQFLVAIEPATGLPPARCPRCSHALQAAPQAPPAVAAPTAADMEREVEADRLAGAASAAALDADALGEALAQGASAGAGVELESGPPATGPARATLPLPLAPRDEAAPDAATAPEPAAAAGDAMASREPDVAPVRSPPAARPRRSATPSFVRTPAGSARPTRRGPIAALAGLTLLLALQLVLADRARLAADARWRPAITTVCDLLRYSLPAWHEPEAFTLVARDVRPARPGVLHVSASFRNDARWAQAWPALHLALQDVDGRTVGARVFAPREYLGRGMTQNDVAPGQVASVAFDVGEPPGTVVAFTFDFR